MNATELQTKESVAPVEACWEETGVHGDRSCPTLQTVVHCRNCAVYSKAGVQLLDRPLLPEYRRAWTEHFAQKRPTTIPAVVSALVFRIASEWLALPTSALQEVAEHRPVHSLPHRRLGVVLGLVNIRGELLICASLEHLLELGRPRSRYEPAGRLVVTRWDGQQVVFPADEVLSVNRFPALETECRAAVIKGALMWQGRSIGLLDPDLLYAALNRSLT